mgnify:CR=1 FL=1
MLFVGDTVKGQSTHLYRFLQRMHVSERYSLVLSEIREFDEKLNQILLFWSRNSANLMNFDNGVFFYRVDNEIDSFSNTIVLEF